MWNDACYMCVVRVARTLYSGDQFASSTDQDYLDGTQHQHQCLTCYHSIAFHFRRLIMNGSILDQFVGQNPQPVFRASML